MAKEKKVKKAKKEKKEKGSFLKSKAFKAFMAKLYGWGASVVIVGALFKIQHWAGAGMMLTVGLTTEAMIFFISAFDVQHEINWTKVYPELIETDEEGEGEEKHEAKSVSAEIEKMLEDAKIEASMVNKLGDGMNKLADTVTGLSDISDAAFATNEYTGKVKVASSNVEKVSEACDNTATAMSHLSEASSSSKEYFEQVKSASGNLSSLNSAYEQELIETNKHLDVLNKFQESFNDAMGGMTDASLSSKGYIDQMKNAADNLSKLNSIYEVEQQESTKHRDALNQYSQTLSDMLTNLSEAGSMSVQLKEGFSKLNENLDSLNNIYGNMLNAMNPARG